MLVVLPVLFLVFKVFEVFDVVLVHIFDAEVLVFAFVGQLLLQVAHILGAVGDAFYLALNLVALLVQFLPQDVFQYVDAEA